MTDGEWADEVSGYPRGLFASELDLPSRIIAVADVFQALTQARPYRGRMSLEEVMHIMTHEVSCGRMDSDVFEVIALNAEECYELSIAESSTESVTER